MSSVNSPQMSIQSLNSPVSDSNIGFYITVVVIIFLLGVTGYAMYDANKKKSVSNDTITGTNVSTGTVVSTGTNVSTSSTGTTGTNISIVNINSTGTSF